MKDEKMSTPYCRKPMSMLNGSCGFYYIKDLVMGTLSCIVLDEHDGVKEGNWRWELTRQCDEEGRDCNDKAIKPGMLAASRTGRDKKPVLPWSLQNELALLTPVNTWILNLLNSC